mgnify:FL=1
MLGKFSPNRTLAQTITFAKRLDNLYAAKAELFEGTEAKEYFEKLGEMRNTLVSTTDKNAVASKLDEYDKARDVSFRNIFTALDAYLIFPNDETLSAAAEVSEAVSKFSRSMTSENYANQSSAETRFFAALDKVKAAVETLPYMSALIEKAKTDEAAFEKANTQYTQSAAAGKGEKSATAVKRELIAFLNDELFPYLSALNVMNKRKYDAFLKEIDFELSRISSGKGAKAKTENAQTGSDTKQAQ